MSWYIFILCTEVFLILPSLCLASLDISVTTDGSYSILVNKKTWLKNAPTFFRSGGKAHQYPGGDLKLVQTTGSSGNDAFGQWTGTGFHYTTGDMNVTALVKVYPHLSDDFIIFSQNYTTDAKGTNAGSYDDVIGGFPAFTTGKQNTSLGYLSFSGKFLGNDYKTYGLWNQNTKLNNCGIKSGPLAIFDETGNCIIISPFSKFMAASLSCDNDRKSVSWGIMGGIESVPAGYHYETILYYDQGINAAFRGWGKYLRQWYNKTDDMVEKDLTVHNLGYWTDNGAYYYYQTEKNKTYEETIIEINTYASQQKIPYNYFQFDSWWYYKSSTGGVKTWQPRPEIFPRGLEYMSSAIKLPFMLHNKYWSNDTTYAIQNGGKFAFVIEDGSKMSVPLQKKFWKHLFKTAKDWNMIVYEQDFLDEEFTGLRSFMTNLVLGRVWLKLMADAAAEMSIPIQYCMSYPRHALQSLEFPAVTQARVSEDYQTGSDNWKIGTVSMFADAIGLRSSKDTFWTMEAQAGNRYNKSEPYTALNGLVAVLSMGPVGPSDMIGNSNISLLMRCCDAKGTILQPDRPATAIDLQTILAAFTSEMTPLEIWTTETTFDAVTQTLSYGILLAVNTLEGFRLSSRDLEFIDNSTEYMYYLHGDHTHIKAFDRNKGLVLGNCTMSEFCLFHFVPKITFGKSAIYVLGDISKWVPMSRQRIGSISIIKGDDLLLDLLGGPFENATISYIVDGQFRQSTCNLGIPGTTTLSLVTGHCPFQKRL